jgi:hypothetical protein
VLGGGLELKLGDRNSRFWGKYLKVQASPHRRTTLLRLLIAVVVSLPVVFTVYADPDLWGHTKFGLEILRLGLVPKLDSYSYNPHTIGWTNHEWLSEVTFGVSYYYAKGQGLFYLRAVLLFATILGFLTLLFKTGLTANFCILLTAITAPYFATFINVRPHSYTYLFTIVVLLCFERYRNGRGIFIWFLPPLFLLWANLHGGFVLGALLAATCTAELLPLSSSLERKKLLLVGVLSFLATLMNPYGTELYSYLHSALSLHREYIGEWQPLAGIQLWHYLFLVVTASILTFASNSWMERKAYSLFFLLSSYTSLVNRRFFILLVIFATLLIALSIAKLWDKISCTKEKSIPAWFTKPSSTIALLGILTLLGFDTARNSYTDAGRILLPSKSYPVNAVNFLKHNSLGPNLALPFRWGEYAIWHLHPSYLVLMDGRYETVYKSSEIESSIKAYHKGDIANFLGEKTPDAVLVHARHKMDQNLGRSKLWKQIYSDNVASIYIGNLTSKGPKLNKPPAIARSFFP